MARNKNLSQRYGSSGNNQLYESLSKIQSALTMAMRQGKLAGTDVQASASLAVSNPVVRLRGNNTIINLYSPDFGCPIYIYSVDGCTFSSTGGNILNDVVMQPDEPAMAQYDRNRDSWFIYSGANGLKTLANVGGGAEVYQSTTWPTANLRTLKGSGATTVTQNASDITIGSPAATVTALSNVGTGAEVYKGMSGTTAQIRKLNAGDGISVTQNTDDITIKTALTATQVAYGSGTNTMTSESTFYRTTEGGLNVIKADNFWTKRSPRVNVKWFGAKGDGSTDDTDAIQAAIDYATTIGATVYFPAGTYIIGKTAGTGLTHKAGVSYCGEGGRKSTGAHLLWRPYTAGAVVNVGGVILTTTHIDISMCSIENLFFGKHASVSTGKVTGILGGCNTVGEYNTGVVTFRDLSFYLLEYGIRGNGAGYDTASNTKIGFFDSVFDNIHYASCEYGVHTGGSGNLHIKPFFIQCSKGALVMDYISAESTSGENINGGTFTQNKYDIYFYDGGGGLYETYRQTNFYGTWFEASTSGIIGYDATIGGTVYIPCLNFQGCVLQTDVNTGSGYLIDGTKITGRLNVNECTLYKNVAADNDQIIGGTATKLMIRDCMYLGTTGWVAPTYIGTDAGMMLVKNAAPAAGNIAALGVTTLVWDVVGATPGLYDFDRETCFDGTSTYTAKYGGTYHSSVTVMLDAFPVGETVDLRISKNGTAVAIFHQNGTGYDVSITIDTTVDLAVGDTLIASVYNPDAVAKTQIVGTYGFTNAHYNTFKVNREF